MPCTQSRDLSTFGRYKLALAFVHERAVACTVYRGETGKMTAALLAVDPELGSAVPALAKTMLAYLVMAAARRGVQDVQIDCAVRLARVAGPGQPEICGLSSCISVCVCMCSQLTRTSNSTCLAGACIGGMHPTERKPRHSR